MKTATLLLALALISTLVSTGTITIDQSNSLWTVKQTSDLSFYNARL
jgi:hypothetical protein